MADNNYIADVKELNEKGQTMPNPLDVLDPKDFNSTEEYIQAAADLQYKQQSPEYKKAYATVRQDYLRREYDKAAEERKQQFEQEIAKTSLNPDEDKKAHDQASREVLEKSKNGFVAPEQVEGEIIKRYMELKTQAIRKKVSLKLTNEAIHSIGV